MANEPLFSPLALGDISLANRIVMAPLTRSRANSLGVPSQLAERYYSDRAAAGMIVTEATQISFEGMGYARTPGIHTLEQIEAWRRIVNAVHARGGKIVLQLWHVGRIASRLNRGVDADVVAPSAVQAPGEIWTDAKGMIPHDVPRALQLNDLTHIKEAYVSAAKTAMTIGFDGVEVHSANGYLLHQFLSSNVNQRSDGYGGSVENRARFPLEVVTAVVNAVGAGKVGVRVSPGNDFNGIEEKDAGALYAHYLGRLAGLNLAYLHVMGSDTEVGRQAFAFAKARYDGRIVAAGGFTPATAAEAVANHLADAVAFGRAFIANPDLVQRIRSGASLNEADPATFYTPGEKGYTDYPRLVA